MRLPPIILLTLTLVLIPSSNAQFKSGYQRTAYAVDEIRRVKTQCDSTRNVPPSNGRYWIAAAEAAGSNVAVWAFFRYVKNEAYTVISLNSIRNNLKAGFWWDEDQFFGNQFNHPYHGSMYYNSARSNGLGFWESAAYALGGSAMWELFMEVEPPSYNDIVNTPVSGIILGEISFRTTSLILDDSKRGLDRVLREATSLLVNPMRGINRIVRGEMWHVGHALPRPEYKIWLSVGGHNVFFERTVTHNRGYALARFDMDYGDLLATTNHHDPFDHFNVHAEIGLSKDDLILGINGSGVLWDRNVTLFDNSSSVLGVYKEFDLLGNLVYHFTATSVTAKVTNVMPLTSSSSLHSSLSISAVLMGGVNSQYAEVYERKYNIGPGASGKVTTALKIQDYGSLYLNYKRFWLHTLNGADSEEFVGLLNIGTNYYLGSRIMLGFDFLLYERYGDYKHLPNIKESNSAARLYVKFVLG
jgi:hypothetical protein